MYIEPSTNIRLLKNVPLDTTYEHTIYFNTKAEQISYFTGLQKYNLTNYTYQRVNRGVARIGMKADLLYDCNYMMFQNTNFGDKWFYAFINAVEYVNDGMSEITFELDDMQTWFFDYELEHCFVEREHTVTDNIGDNTVKEDLYFDEYEDLGLMYSYSTNMEMCIAVATSVLDQGAPAEGKLIHDVYNGVAIIAYKMDEDGVESLNNFLASVNDAGMSDAILNIFMMPKDFYSSTGFPKTLTITKDTGILAGGYEPKNKKLFTYPYSLIRVSNGQGGASEYRYEFFGNETECTFEYFGDLSPTPSVLFYPLSYKGAIKNYDEGILMNNFPQCSWVTDSYRAYIAQNATNIGMSLASTLATTAMATAINPIAGVVTGAISIGSSLTGAITARLLPPQAHGSNTSTLNMALGRFNFWITKISVRPQYAKIIDDYFNIHGYACKQVKIPNRNSRPHWNYVKTMGCMARGSVPADAMRKICGIYDKGVTFWKYGHEIGNYSLDNRPV